MNYQSLVEMQEDSCRKFKGRPMYGVKRDKKGPYKWINFQQFARWVNMARGGLSQLGISPDRS